jgi:hypothetical protein
MVVRQARHGCGNIRLQRLVSSERAAQLLGLPGEAGDRDRAKASPLFGTVRLDVRSEIPSSKAISLLSLPAMRRSKI